MPYVERITRAGKTIEIERYFTSRYKKNREIADGECEYKKIAEILSMVKA